MAYEKRKANQDSLRLRNFGRHLQRGPAYDRRKIIESMIPMHDRSNGLGGGFAAYGIDQLRMSETEAHRYIEKQAMDRCVSRRVIAEKILSAYR